MFAKTRLGGDKQDLLRKIAGWTGIVCSSLAGILFVLRLVGVSASIQWQDDFLNDGNYANWRQPLFSFAPNTFVDVWTPFIFFWIGIGIHVQSMPFRLVKLNLGRNYIVYFLFHFMMAFFGGIGYGGDIGIILGSCQFGCATILAILVFLSDGEPVLKLDAKVDLKTVAENDSTNLFAKITGWLSFIAALMVIIVGFFRIVASDATLHWDDNDALNDQNRVLWRQRLFTFAPDYFVDAWTPLFMGLVATMCHLKSISSKVKMIHQSHIRHFVYFMAMGLFGCIGYAGDLGIILSGFVFLAALFQLIAIFIAKNQPIILELALAGSFKLQGEGVNVGGEQKV